MADDIFDDEEDPIVYFEQDPEADDVGVGYATRKSGARVYGPMDPDKALELHDAGKAEIPGMEARPPAPAAPAAAAPKGSPGNPIDLDEEPEAPAAQPAPAPSGGSPGDVRRPAGEDRSGYQNVQIPASSRIAAAHNNPGNLKFAGQAGAEPGEEASDGGRFARFRTPEAGLAALDKQIGLDAGRGKTLGQFITGYAPPGSNDTARYVQDAEKALGVNAETAISKIDPVKLRNFIAQKESSTPPASAAAAAPLPPNMARNSRQESEQRAAQSAQSASVQGQVAQTGSAQPVEQFEAQQQQTARGYQQAAEGAIGNAFQQAAPVQQRAEALAQMARDKEVATSAAMAQREDRARRVQDTMQRVAAKKPDYYGIWKDKGAGGTVLGLLGVALRSLHATKFGGPNTALQSIQEQRKLNIQSQMEDKGSELHALERELGSLDAAVPVLEARMRDAEARRLEGMMVGEQSAAILANGRTLVDKLRIERDAKLSEAAKAFYGTLAKQQAITQTQSAQQSQTVGSQAESTVGTEPTHGGAGKTAADQMKDIYELDKQLEERGYKKDTRAAMIQQIYPSYKPGDTESAPERTNREQAEKVEREEENMNEDQAKAESGIVSLNAFGLEGGLERDGKTGKWKEPGFFDNALANPGWKEPLAKLWGGATPFADAQAVASEAIGRLQSGGAITKEEETRFKAMVGEPGLTKAQLASRLNSIEAIVNARRKAKFRKAGTRAPESWKSKPAGEEVSP